MADRQPIPRQGLQVPGNQPLVGLVFNGAGGEVTRFFADDAAGNAEGAEVIRNAMQLIGAWSDLSWDEMEPALDRIRHESPPSPPFEA